MFAIPKETNKNKISHLARIGLKWLTPVACSVLLVACGGGSDSAVSTGNGTEAGVGTETDSGSGNGTGSGGTTTPDTGSGTAKTVQNATFSVASLTHSAAATSSVNGSFQITNLDPTLTAGGRSMVRDANGRFSVTILSGQGSSTINVLYVGKVPSTAGTYTGEFEVAVCTDATCTAFARDLPAKLPYTLTVTP